MKSKLLQNFCELYINTENKQKKETLWAQLKTPLLEIVDQENSLVTFLYKLSEEDLKHQANIFLYSTVVVPFEERYKLQPIINTDICALSLILPNTLRTTYNFAKIDNSVNFPEITQRESSDSIPIETGKFAILSSQINYLYENKKIEIDTKNPNTISYPIDFENPTEVFTAESILELSKAPQSTYCPIKPEDIKHQREKLKRENRFQAHEITVESYRGRKYWIYYPFDYFTTSNNQYPFLLFLDGSTYIDTIPSLSILENMACGNSIPPCIAVFLDYSSTDRWQEYYCNDPFTRFITNDFIELLRTKHQLRISDDYKQRIIVGSSASGLAAFYACLTRPDIFGNAITQSASFEAKKGKELEKLLEQYAEKNQNSLFFIETGSYETFPIDLIFTGGTKQSQSSYQANRALTEMMQNQHIPCVYHEFIGGHSYVCYRISLPERLQEVFTKRLK